MHLNKPVLLFILAIACVAPGWAQKDSLSKVIPGQSIVLEELKVMGYLDNPDPIYIFDMVNDSDWTPIRVDRNLVMDPVFNRNISKENFEWENEIYYYKGSVFKSEAIKLKK
ncbi:MAG: hypothetical protein JNL74_20465 [Fibrobacteres bacterium]|nr:hypothetical protein [Fibrobacterota bacterium]